MVEVLELHEAEAELRQTLLMHISLMRRLNYFERSVVGRRRPKTLNDAANVILETKRHMILRLGNLPSASYVRGSHPIGNKNPMQSN